MLAQLYDRVLEVERIRAHDSSYPSKLLSDTYRDMFTKLHLFDSVLLPYERVCFIDADLLPIRCFDHLFTLPAPAAVIESVDPMGQYTYVHHMHGVRHGEPVPPAILEVTSAEDVTGGINGGLLVIKPDSLLFADMVGASAARCRSGARTTGNSTSAASATAFRSSTSCRWSFRTPGRRSIRASTRCAPICRTASACIG